MMTASVSTAVTALPSDEISREELFRRRGDSSLIVVDVLPKDGYDSGHIPGAVNLPVDELTERAPEVLPNRAAEIAVYCGSFS